MEYRQLGQTDVRVSVICLGTMTWGDQNTQDDAFQQLDVALSEGVNFIDVAEMYPVPPRAETYADTERIIGRWLEQRKNRDKVVLATKVAGRSDWLPWVRDGKPCLDRANIESAVDASLKRLRTDYIDLYQLHWPDRNTNYFGKLGYQHQQDETVVPIAETLQVMSDLVKAGKIRHVGLSNETPWGVMSFLDAAKASGLARVVSVQNPYSLLNRTYEVGLAEISHREQIGLLAYSPLGFGMLSGKYLNDAKPAGARLTLFTRFSRYSNPLGRAAAQAYVQIAQKYSLDPAQMALAYVNSRPFLTSTIIGATTLTQLRSNLASANLKLSPAVLEEIENVHERVPNPCP